MLVDLGETNRNRSASFAAQFRAYPELLGSPRFWGYALTAAFTCGAFFAFIGGGPYVATEMLGLTPSQYGFYFGIISVGYMLGNFLSGRFAKVIGINRMMLSGNIVATSGMVLAIVLFGAGLYHPLSLFGPAFFTGMGNGITLPSANAGIVSVKPHLAGSASGLGGAMQIGGGAALSVLAGALLTPQSGPFPLLWVMLLSSAAAAVSTLYVIHVARREGRRVMSAARIAGLVLAGGRATRLGGGDKPLRPIGGRPMLAHVLERLTPQVGPVAISANGDPARFAEYGLPVLADDGRSRQGRSPAYCPAWLGRRRPAAKSVLTVAGDTPFFPHDLAARLNAAIGGHRDGIAVAASGGRRHPVFALWPVSLEADLRRFPGRKRNFSVAAFHGAASNGIASTFRSATVGGKSLDPFFNVNTPEDLAEAEAIAAGRQRHDAARIRHHRLEEFRQDDADRKTGRGTHAARLEGLDRQACASRLRHRQARAPTASATGRRAPARSQWCPAGAGR